MALLFVPSAWVFGLPEPTPNLPTIAGSHRDDRPTLPTSPAEYDDTWTKISSHDDGKIDYAVRFDKQGNKMMEAFDTHHNGFMTDFLFYEDGIRVREEVDSKHQRRIDLWVYFYEGIYVSRFERSTKADGIVDIVKIFGTEKK